MTNSESKAQKVIVGVDTHMYGHVAVAIDTRGTRLGDHARLPTPENSSNKSSAHAATDVSWLTVRPPIHISPRCAVDTVQPFERSQSAKRCAVGVPCGSPI